MDSGSAFSPGRDLSSQKLYDLPTMDRVMIKNRQWANERVEEDPQYFDRLCDLQEPEFLWIGCADSRVPANVLAGMAPGEVFVQRNVGNQAMHTDLNCMTCIEYAVSVLKVKTIIICGHYNCGAVAAALKMPMKAPGLVNCWISDIRECRNQHWEELSRMNEEDQVTRLCEYNVMRQTFHVCTSPAVQAAWDEGQNLSVVGVVYSLKDGLLKKLVGPISHDTDLETHDPETFMQKFMERFFIASQVARDRRSTAGFDLETEADRALHVKNTVNMVDMLARHSSWGIPRGDGVSSPGASPRSTRSNRISVELSRSAEGNAGSSYASPSTAH